MSQSDLSLPLRNHHPLLGLWKARLDVTKGVTASLSKRIELLRE